MSEAPNGYGPLLPKVGCDVAKNESMAAGYSQAVRRENRFQILEARSLFRNLINSKQRSPSTENRVGKYVRQQALPWRKTMMPTL
jgi:hypothetical protein